MTVNPAIAAFAADMTAWRRDIHAHPETAFEETRTAAIVAAALAGFGIEVATGLAGTGVVGTLRGSGRGGGGTGTRAIGLRADLDALDVTERNSFEHASTHPGKMHACGHDGHTAMLLGAARHLARTRRFDGTVHFIFQPAEENEGGGRVMVEEGLFDRHPVDAVYGMHNWPGLPAGEFAVRPGPMMASFDIFEITISGRGAHGAMPHLGHDPMLTAAALTQALQTVVSREIDPQQPAVVSVTQIHGGDAWNVIPGEAVLRGTTRSFDPATQDRLEAAIRRITDGICAAHRCHADVRYERRYPPTVNSRDETDLCRLVAAAVAGPDGVHTDLPPSMGSEDFAYMLREKPGCYVWIGNGPAAGGCLLHNDRYDFNDDILPVGATYWASLVETALPLTEAAE